MKLKLPFILSALLIISMTGMLGHTAGVSPRSEVLLSAAPAKKVPARTAHKPAQKKSGLNKPVHAQPAMSLEDQLEYDTLKLQFSKAIQAEDVAQQKEQLKAFLERSKPFVDKYPSNTAIWVLRANAALKTDDARAGWEASQQLKAEGALASPDERMRQLLSELNLKGWFKDIQENPKDEKANISIDKTCDWVKDNFNAYSQAESPIGYPLKNKTKLDWLYWNHHGPCSFDGSIFDYAPIAPIRNCSRYLADTCTAILKTRYISFRLSDLKSISATHNSITFAFARPITIKTSVGIVENTEIVNNFPKGTEDAEEKINRLTFNISGGMAKRFENALNHAISLYRAEHAEPF